MIRTVLFVCAACPCWAIRVEEISELTHSLADKYESPATSILGTDYQTWRERRETFLVSKYLAMYLNKYTLVSGFNDYKELALQTKTTLFHRTVNVLLGWHHNISQDFAKFSNDFPMSHSIWLILLDARMSVDLDMSDWDVKVNTRLIVASYHEGNTVQLTECYRTKPGPDIVTKVMGSWHNGTLSFVPRKPYPWGRSNQKGLKLRVTTSPQMSISSAMRLDNGEVALGGLFGIVFKELSEIMNITIDYVNAVENGSGKFEEGKWTGVIGMIVRNETDIAIAPITYEANVIRVTHLIHPLMSTNYQIFFKSNVSKIGLDAILQPFEYDVWLSILVWLMVTPLFFSILFNVQSKRGMELDRKHEFRWLNLWLVFLQALCQQGHHKPPQSLACRICFLMAYATSIIIVTSYSAVLISIITAEQPQRPFNSLQEFLKVHTHALITNKRTIEYTYFSQANDTLRRQIFRTLMKVVPDKYFKPTYQELMEVVCDSDNYALFARYELAKSFIRDVSMIKQCRVLHLTQPLDRVFMSIAIHKGHPLSTIFSYQVQKMAETGIIDRLKKDTDEAPRLDAFKGVIQVEIEQVIQIFSILLLGVFLSSVILMGELYLARKTRASSYDDFSEQTREPYLGRNRKTEERWMNRRNVIRFY